MKYRLDEPIYRGKGLKRTVWIEAYYLSPDDAGKLHEIYTENYQQIDLIQVLKDIQNHQIQFDPNHRYYAYHCLDLCQ